MRYLAVCLVLTLAAAALVGCDDDPCSISTRTLRGSVRMPDGQTPAGGSQVFLGRPYDESGLKWAYIDSAGVGPSGRFEFTQLPQGTYRAYARRDGKFEPPSYAYITLPSATVVLHGMTGGQLGDLVLQAVASDGLVSGHVYLEESQVPIEGAFVELLRLEGAFYVVADTMSTGADGSYAFAAVSTGHYRVYGMKTYPDKGPFTLYSEETADFFCDGAGAYPVPPLHLVENDLIRKPAIYIYPEAAGRHQVRLDLHQQARIVSSIPEYGSGWDVFVDRTGLIDGRYDYLFYEVAAQVTQPAAAGWCLAQEELADRLPAILAQLGLNEAETDDFMAYWLDVLTGHAYYRIHPIMQGEIDRWVELSVTPRPDSMLRFWLLFAGTERFEPLPPFSAPEFTRTGATVVEWGGALLR